MRSAPFLTLVAINIASSQSSFAATAAKPANGVKINGVTYDSSNSAGVKENASKSSLSPEQMLRLKKVFLFPSVDDLNGALAPKLDEKLVDLFNHNTRFELIRDPQVVKALSPDDSSYYKAAASSEVHKEAARVTGADTTVLLRTRNVGPDTRMTLELRDADGNILFAEEGSVPGAARMDERWAETEKLYRGILAKLPFEGTVTGRTANTITVDLGVGSMRPNEIIELARIVSIQRHPLLGTVIGTDYVRTGRAKIQNVDRVLSFAEVIEEFPGEKVNPGQKVLRQQANLVHRGEAESPQNEHIRENGRRSNEAVEGANESNDEGGLENDRLKGAFDHAKPRFGQLGIDLYYGNVGNDQMISATETDFTGSGFGGEASGELWITKNWILSGNYTFQNASLGASNQPPAGSSTWDSYQILAGYRLYPEGVGEGVALTASLGYREIQMQIPPNSAIPLGGRNFTGLDLSIDGDMKFLDNQKLNAGFSIMPFSSISETGPALGTPSGGTVIGVHLSWHHAMTDELWFKVGLRYDVANGSYSDTGASVTVKHFAIGPGVYYLF